MRLFALAVGLLVVFSVFAGEHGLWRSGNGGLLWGELTPPTHARINGLDVTGQNLTAATDAGLFMSDDLGRTWRAAGGALTNARVLVTLYFGTNLLAGTAEMGLRVSRDAGRTFAAISGVSPKMVRSLAASETRVYAGFDSGEVFASSDLKEWTNLSSGLPANAQIFELHSSNGDLFAALYSRGLWRYRGGAWERLGGVEPLTMLATGDVLLAGHNPGGLYRSVDGGETWEKKVLNLPLNGPSWTLHRGRDFLFYGTSGESGLYRSADRGRSWEPVRAAGFSGSGIVAMASQGATVFAATVRSKLRPGVADPLSELDLLRPLGTTDGGTSNRE